MTLYRSGRILYSALAFLFAISLTYRVREIADRADELLHPLEHVRDPFDLGLPGNEILSVQPEAEAAGIRKGDALLVFADRPYTGAVGVQSVLRVARAGERVAVRVQAGDGTVKDASVELRSDNEETSTREAVMQIILNAVPLFCVLLGFWVAAVRIRDPRAWIFLAMMIAFAEMNGGLVRTWVGHDDFFQPIGAAYQPFFSNIIGAAMLLFGIYFPERLGLDRRWPWLKWIVIGPILFNAAQLAVTIVLMGKHIDLAIAFTHLLPMPGPLILVLHMLGMTCFFAAIAYKSFAEASRDARRRLFLLYAGSTASMAPFLLVVVAHLVMGRPPFDQTTIFTITAFLMLVGFPVTIAYVVVVERAMDVRVVVRQGLQYLLASKGATLLQILLSAAVIVAASVGSQDLSRPGRIQVISIGIFGILLIRQFALKLRTFIDRRFFREAYDAEQILSDLANKVRTMVGTSALLETVAHRISESLHIPRVAVLLNGGGAFRVAYALGYSALPAETVPVDGSAIDTLVKAQFDADLVLPLSVNEKVLGLLSLGPKRSEEPYSKLDIRLLETVASQAGLALENSRLAEEIASEVAQRERMNREIEIAREVQERLFPQDFPQIEGMDYAGTCRPALGVGGDYYDFIQLSETELGIAIGDVSGKGIAAALLMASLRASLRGQTIRRESDLAALMANVNKLVYEGSTSNRYATFFYAQFDSVSKKLTYVNAGHNPPLIFRGNEVIRLETGGAVVGLLPMFPYEQAVIQLQPSDLLVAFTDGISEAMNSAQQEWGEDQLIQCVRRGAGANAQQTIASIMAGADAFAAGAKQHDDMTIIVASLM